jgi:hypothetical protein
VSANEQQIYFWILPWTGVLVGLLIGWALLVWFDRRRL